MVAVDPRENGGRLANVSGAPKQSQQAQAGSTVTQTTTEVDHLYTHTPKDAQTAHNTHGTHTAHCKHTGWSTLNNQELACVVVRRGSGYRFSKVAKPAPQPHSRAHTVSRSRTQAGCMRLGRRPRAAGSTMRTGPGRGESARHRRAQAAQQAGKWASGAQHRGGRSERGPGQQGERSAAGRLAEARR